MLVDRNADVVVVAALAATAWPNAPDVLCHAALARLAAKQPRPALTHLRRATRLDPNNAAAALLLAIAHGETGQDDKARAALDGARLTSVRAACRAFIGPDGMTDWMLKRWEGIQRRTSVAPRAKAGARSKTAPVAPPPPLWPHPTAPRHPLRWCRPCRASTPGST